MHLECRMKWRGSFQKQKKLACVELRSDLRHCDASDLFKEAWLYSARQLDQHLHCSRCARESCSPALEPLLPRHPYRCRRIHDSPQAAPVPRVASLRVHVLMVKQTEFVEMDRWLCAAIEFKQLLKNIAVLCRNSRPTTDALTSRLHNIEVTE